MSHFSEAHSLFDSDDIQIVAPINGRAPSYMRDHRKRLRERFLTGGADAVPDYELLELILFRAIPRQDVKPLARALIDHFGDFNRVLSCSKSKAWVTQQRLKSKSLRPPPTACPVPRS
jgi:DNA repair protein RadC